MNRFPRLFAMALIGFAGLAATALAGGPADSSSSGYGHAGNAKKLHVPSFRRLLLRMGAPLPLTGLAPALLPGPKGVLPVKTGPE